MQKLMLMGALLAMSVPVGTAAQDRDRKFDVGIRSGLVTGTINLSGLDPAFADLEPDGAVGPHMSGFFFMVRVRPHLRLGVETLVANSDKEAATTMSYQAAGPVVELSYGKSWYVAGAVHAGGLVVNVMSRSGAAPAEGASAGAFFKGDGYFVAPSVDVGYRFRRAELGLFVKQVNVFGESDRGGMSELGSSFMGLRFALGL